MNILHIIPSLQKGGAERIVLDICSALQQRKNTSVALVLLHPKIEYELPEHVQPVCIPAEVHLSVWKKNRIQVAPLQSFMESFKPDVIHTHLFEAEIVSRSCLYPKAKWVSHCHSNMEQFGSCRNVGLGGKQQLTECYEKRYLIKRYRHNGGNRFIAISKDTERYFLQHLPHDLQRVTMLSNAVNTQRFAKPASLRPPDEPPLRLITVGSLVDRKNQIFLVEVVNYLKAKGKTVQLTIVGEGVNRNLLQKKCDDYGLNREVVLTGLVERVEQRLWQSHIYLHAAISEPFGLVLVEAMAAGLPVVCTDGGGNRDIVRNGVNGFILAKPSVEEFAQKIEALWQDKQGYERMSQNALQTARQLDIAPYTDELMRLYEA